MVFEQFATLALSEAVPAQMERVASVPVESRLNLASPALSVMQDFRQHPPATVQDQLDVEQAMELFRVLQLRYLLVEDARGNMQGILTADAVLGPQRMMQLRLHQVLPHELSVRELMIPRARLLSVPYAALSGARIGDVLHTLEVSGQHFLCVHDGDAAKQTQLRGLFCAREIGERLGMPWSPPLRARTFSELSATLLGRADLNG
jgi:hypothetical protein